MNSCRLLACVLWAGFTARAFPVEHLRFRVNGVLVSVERATGSDAHRLVSRDLDARRVAPEGLPAQWATRAGWRELASLRDHRSQVLQLRGDGADLEALRSTIDLRDPVIPPDNPPLALPPGTTVQNDIEELSPNPSHQWLVRSRWSPSSLHAWMRFAARVRGWSVEKGDASTLHFVRAHQRLLVVLIPGDVRSPQGSSALLTSWGRR
jgi:hypothetical protein